MTIYNQFGNIGFKYVGEFKNNAMFGRGVGIIYDRNGKKEVTQDGWWEDGKFLGDK